MTAKRKRTPRAPEHWPSPRWRVTIAEHDVPPRWHVAAQEVTVGAATAESACHAVVRIAHIDAGVAPLHSLLALSLAHATAELARTPAMMRSEAA